MQQEPKLASYFEMHVRGFYIVEVYYHVDLTVTEGFIVGLFFIQAPQEWMKANTKAFLNYTIFDMKKYVIRISFCSGSLCQMLFLEPSFSVLISWHAGVSFEDGNTYH